MTHAGGTTTVTLNQKQNGGVWMSLGSFSLTPGAGHKVTLAASANGATIADALLFAGPTVQPANLLYVHADHLGSPQKLTNTTQAIAWDGVFDPFGEEVALTGLAAMPMRFPGQYADDETGYSYNYFRDYDPALGRYVQSDPIGLLAGLNPYAYVNGKPNAMYDRFGLDPYDRFDTPGGAAIDVLDYINPQSIRENKEYGGLICQDPHNGVCIATEPVAGDERHVVMDQLGNCPMGTIQVGDYHTHADYSWRDPVTGEITRTSDPKKDNLNSDSFSYRDLHGTNEEARDRQIGYESYLDTPSGKKMEVQSRRGNLSTATRRLRCD